MSKKGQKKNAGKKKTTAISKKKIFWIVTITTFIVLSLLYMYGHYKVHHQKNSKDKEEVELDLNTLKPYIESDDNYLLIEKYYQLNIVIEDKTITINFKNDEHQGKLKGKLNNQLLSFKIKNEDKNALLKAMLIFSVVDGLGQINGNEKGYVSAMLSDYDLETATLDHDGFELTSEEDNNIYKFKVDKKFNLGNIMDNYFTLEDLEQYKESFTTDKYIETKKGNLILYKDTDFYKNHIIYICESTELTTRTYNSLLNIINLVYGEEYKEKFQTEYPELITSRVLDKFDIEINYQPTETDVIKKIITENYKLVKITYKN